jgi:hypothetical protein
VTSVESDEATLMQAASLSAFSVLNLSQYTNTPGHRAQQPIGSSQKGCRGQASSLRAALRRDRFIRMPFGRSRCRVLQGKSTS